MAISNADGSITLTTKVDQSGLKKGMSTIKNSTSSAKNGVSSLTNAVGKLGAAIGIAFSVGALIKFSKEASNLATTAEASVQRLIDIYGSASQAVGDFIDANANALGMSRAAAASYASVYGNLFSVWADQQTNAALTTQYLNMTAVVASKTGRTVEDVQERIRSGLLGNTEAIEDLGVFVNVKTIEMTDAFQRMANGNSWEQLDAYTQQQIRTMAILEQATAKYGDQVAQTSALTKSQFQAAWQDFQATWGQVVNRVLMPILEVLTDIIIAATTAMRSLFGISSSTIQQSNATENTVENQKELTDEIEETEKALKKTTAGFDDLQILSSSAKDNVSDIGISSSLQGIDASISNNTENLTPVIDTSFLDVIYEKLSMIANLFMSGFWSGFQNADFTLIQTSLSGIASSLLSMFSNPMLQQSVQSFASSVVITLGQIVGSIASIGTTIATNLLSAFNIYLSQNAPFITKSIANIFDASSGIVKAVGNTWESFAKIFSVLAEENGINLTANIIEIFSNANLGIAEIATKAGEDFINLLTQPIINNESILAETLDEILGILSSWTDSISSLVSWLFEEINNLYDKHIRPLVKTITEVVSAIVESITTAFNTYILPVLQDFAEEFGRVVEEYVKPMFEKIFNFVGKLTDAISKLMENVILPVVQTIIKVVAPAISNFIKTVGRIFNDLIKTVSGVIGGIMDMFSGLIDFFTGIFTGDLGLAFEGIKSYFGGLFEGIASLFKGVLNIFIDVINGLVGGINGAIGLINEIPGVEIPKIPEIPRLAQGAVIPPNREFLAVLGDQRQGTNIETPLATMIEAFQIALDSRGGTGSSEIVLEIDGREFGRAVVEQGNKENRRIGTRLVVV